MGKQAKKGGGFDIVKHIELVKVADVIPTPDNPRRVDRNDPKVRELAASIKESGLLQPVLCRPHPTQPGKLDLRAGARRLEAFRLLRLAEIPAVVREMSEEEAVRITVLENMHREELTPLEEGRGLARLLEVGGDAKAIAGNLGKSLSWVWRRAKLARMVTRWQDAVEGLGRFEGEDGLAYRKLSAAHLEIVARLPAETQERLFDDLHDYHLGQRVDAFARTVETMVERHLHTAPWVKVEASASVLDGTAMCKECPKRQSVNADLFDVLPEGEDRCLDATCFLRKRNAFVELRWRQASEMWPAAVRLTREFRGSRGVLGNTEYAVGKKSEQGVVPGVVVEGADKDLGKVLWVHVAAADAAANGRRKTEDGSDTDTEAAEERPVERADDSPAEKRLAALRFWLRDAVVERVREAGIDRAALEAVPMAVLPWALLLLIVGRTTDLMVADLPGAMLDLTHDAHLQANVAAEAMDQAADSLEVLISSSLKLDDAYAVGLAKLVGIEGRLQEWMAANEEEKFAAPGPQAAGGKRVRR